MKKAGPNHATLSTCTLSALSTLSTFYLVYRVSITRITRSQSVPHPDFRYRMGLWHGLSDPTA